MDAVSDSISRVSFRAKSRSFLRTDAMVTCFLVNSCTKCSSFFVLFSKCMW